jgi:hypothetical protein
MTPRLIHPVTVTVKPIDRASTEQNTLAREPVKVLKRATTLTLQAQVQWARRNDPDAQRGGAVRHDAGYLICLVTGLDSAGWTPIQGDLITDIGAIANLALYVTGSEPCMHYDGIHKGLMVNFADKRPARG